jgi:acetyl esterase
MPLHPQAKAFLKAQESLDAPDITTNLVEYRAMSHLEDDLAGPLTPGVRIEHRYLTSPTADLPVNLYIPQGNGPFNGLVYFHGGGWVAYDINRYSPQLSALAASTNSVVVAVNYQKAPEHKFPIPFDDCYSALEWTFANSAELSIDIKKIGIGGDSAGGNLASGVAIKARDQGKFDVAYQLLIYPANSPSFVSTPDVPNATGFGSTQAGIKWAWEQYLRSDKDLVNPYAVPHSAADLSNLPPTILITAEFDVLREDGKEYARKLEISGNSVTYKDFPGMIHGFFNCQKYIDDAVALREYIAENVLKILKGLKP